MYRQFLICKEDRKYKKILWLVNDEIKEFTLNTVTFGVNSASYLAIRCLHQLAEDEEHRFPLAAKILKSDMYVDNMLTGTNNKEEARDICLQMINILNSAGMKLSQWASNDLDILENISSKDLDVNFDFDNDSSLKTLGIQWMTKTDAFTYKIQNMSPSEKITKRKIFSKIAKIFDPIGFLGPIILFAKKLMQTIWQYASEVGYGACVYLRSQNINEQFKIELMCSKSRVAPLKTRTIPQVELCAMQLLTNLVDRVILSIQIKVDQVYLWSDSSIALNWINTQPNLLKTFVANRVVDIRTKSNVNNWFHIQSKDNPADALSRGQLPHEFLKITYGYMDPHGFHDPLDQPLNISDAYSGRIACAYNYGKLFTCHRKNDPDSHYGNLCVAIYEYKSKAVSEWILEDKIHYKNFHLPRIEVDQHLDLRYLYDRRFLKKETRTYPSFTDP
ncbi:uncharacterized protein [Prorops nasuta]|uniref:uncharacterized protein n=1 Tax=Prorops nasuta TaxID=863751 RepID=UPI0034CE18BE